MGVEDYYNGDGTDGKDIKIIKELLEKVTPTPNPTEG